MLIYIFDEPFNQLDKDAQDTLCKILNESNFTKLVVSHQDIKLLNTKEISM